MTHTGIHTITRSPFVEGKCSAAATGRMRNGGFSSGRNGSGSRTCFNNSNGSAESSTSESSSIESIDCGSSDTEGIDRKSTKIKMRQGWIHDESSGTRSWETRSGREGSPIVERAAAGGSTSSIWRCMLPAQQNMQLMPTLGSVAVMRDILERFTERVEAEQEELKKQLLFRPALPDSVRLELLGSVNRVVNATNEVHRRRRRHPTRVAATTAADMPTGTQQRINRKVTQLAAGDAPPGDERRAGQSGNVTGLALPTKVPQDSTTVASQATHHIEASGLEGRTRHSTETVTVQKNTNGRTTSQPQTVDGGSKNSRTAEGGDERYGTAERPPQAPQALRAYGNAHRLLLTASDDKGDDSDGHQEKEDGSSDGYTSDDDDDFEVDRDDKLRASDFIDGFRLMLQPALDDPLERYVRIRRPDSAVLRLLDYYQQQADLYEAWDWERDPLLGGSSGVRYPQRSAFDVKEMLRDAVALHEQLLMLNLNNTRVLTRMQDQLAEAWTEADPAVKEADRLFVKSVVAVAEAMYTQKRIDDWNLTVLADRALGKREKYLVYDPATGRLRFLREAYMADIIPKEIDSEKLSRELNRKIGALFRNADRRHRTRPQTRRESSQNKVGLAEGHKARTPSAAPGAPTPAPAGTSGALAAIPGGSPAAKKLQPGGGAAVRAVAPLSQAAALPSTKVLPFTAVAEAKQKVVPAQGLRADTKRIEKGGKQPLESPRLPQPDISRPTAPKLLPSKAGVAGGAQKSEFLSPTSTRPAAAAPSARGSVAFFTKAAPGVDAVATGLDAATAPFCAPSKSSLPSGPAAAPKHEGETFVDSSAEVTLLRSPGLRKASDSSALKAGAVTTWPAGHLQSTAKAATSATKGPRAPGAHTTEALSKGLATTQDDVTRKLPLGAELDSRVLRSSEMKGQLILPTAKQQEMPVPPPRSIPAIKSLVNPSSSSVAPNIAAGGKASPAALPRKPPATTTPPTQMESATGPSVLSKSKPLPATSLAPGAARKAVPSLSTTTPAGGQTKIGGRPMQLRKRLPLPPPKMHA